MLPFNLIVTLLIALNSLICLFYCPNVDAIEVDPISIRTSFSRPDTSQTLIYRSPTNDEKLVFLLSALNNERIGLFFDVNEIEVGYAVNVNPDPLTTETQNIFLSYRKFEHSKITFNYQNLKGLNTQSSNALNPESITLFSEQSKSRKLELFGQHNLYSFGARSDAFKHFFLNRPQLSNNFDAQLSINAGWSIKHIRVDNPESIIFNPDFNVSPIDNVTSLESLSYNADLGPFLSLKFPNNIQAFAEYKIGKGYINNISDVENLKESGDEKLNAVGAGLSWTSSNQKNLVLLKAWRQSGRHIETSFGELSVLYFF